MTKKTNRRIFTFILTTLIILSNSTHIFASELDDIESIIYEQDSFLPLDGTDSFEIITKEESKARVTYITLYNHEYTKGSVKYGSWRTGASGGSNVADITLNFNNLNNITYNTSFTATISGSYDKGATIGGALGVTVGQSKSYSLGSGISVKVPKGKKYTVKYRPVYYKYTVKETKYQEAYLPGYGWHRPVLGTKTSYVDVFSHWDFTVIK